MRKFYTIAAIVALLPVCLFSQGQFELGDKTPYVITKESAQAEEQMKQGLSKPLQVELGRLKEKDLKRQYKIFMSNYKGKETGQTELAKTTSNKEQGSVEFITKNAIIPMIAGNCYIDVHSSFRFSDSTITWEIWFDVGKVQFTSQEFQSKYAGAQTFIRLFKNQIQSLIYELQREEQIGIKMNLLKERKSTGKDIAFSIKTVEELKYKVDKLKMEIEDETLNIVEKRKKYKQLEILITERDGILVELTNKIREDKP